MCMSISAIVCVDKNWGIGYQGNLLAKIPEDMMFFKTMTEGHTVVMGKTTYDSLPVKPLKNRNNIVITYHPATHISEESTTLTFLDMNQIKKLLTGPKSERETLHEIYIAGGQQIYNALLPYCQRAYVTKILYAYPAADVYFPNIDEQPEWNLSSTSDIKEYDGVLYQFCIYDRVDKEEVANEKNIV